MDAGAHVSFEFGPFRLDLSEQLLVRDGKAVHLAPKLFETLAILVENSGHILAKDDLIKRLWPDTFVEESNLAQNIFQLRKVLQEETSGQRYIETVPKRGYRFSAHVRDIFQGDDETAVSSPTNGRSFIKENNHGLAVKSLAVLPFKSLGKDEGADEYLGLGMADATIIKLSGFRQLVVLPTNAVFKYAGRQNDALAIGRKLSVEAVLDGTIQRAGERLRVTVQLISLADGQTLWSGKFDEQFTDIFNVQDSISEQVAGALARGITRVERGHLRKRATENTEAYQSYLMGLFFWRKRSTEGLGKAVEYFQEAIAKDPFYALAYAGLADSYFWIAYHEFDVELRDKYFEESRSNALKAVEIDPFVAEAHAALGTVKVKHDRDPAGAEQEFKRAITVNPGCAMAYSRYTYFLVAIGRLDESLQMIKRAQKLDPLSPDANTSLAYVLYFARDYNGSIRYCERALALEPNFLEALLLLGLSYQQQRMLESAIMQFNRARDIYPESTEPLELLGHVFALTGDGDKARVILSELDSSPKQRSIHPYNIALIYAALGRTEQAFNWLEKPYVNWTERLRVLRFDPRMDSLRSDPRFSALFQGSSTETQR